MSELKEEFMTPAQYAKFDAYRRGQPAPVDPAPAPDEGQQGADGGPVENTDQRPPALEGQAGKRKKGPASP